MVEPINGACSPDPEKHFLPGMPSPERRKQSGVESRRAVEAESLPAFQPGGIRFDEARSPRIVALPVRFKFLQLENRLPPGAITGFAKDGYLRHSIHRFRATPSGPRLGSLM